MGLAGRLGEEWRAELYELPSLPSCIYLSLHPEEAGGEIRLHTEQWQKKMKVSRGGGGGRRGRGGSCVGLGLGLGSRSAGLQRTGLTLSCRRAGEGVAVSALLGKRHSWGKSSQAVSSLKGSLESSGQTE